MTQFFRPSSIKNIEVTDSLFGSYLAFVAERIVPYQWEILNNRVEGAKSSFCMDNFKIAAGEQAGSHQGICFGDTDAYKWLEAVAFCCENGSGSEFIPMADELIALIGRAQEPNGYLNTYFTIDHPERKWTNLAEGHELYSAGHLIEAAVAYHRATGKDALLTIAMRLADHICKVFAPDGQRADGCPGHPEIELALVKLYETTGRSDYLDLASHFVAVRGKDPRYFMKELLSLRAAERIFLDLDDFDSKYAQMHERSVNQASAEGHAVRAMYLYSAMTDLAAIQDDAALAIACEALWDSTTRKRMYITGGIGSSADLERFTADYDLPNDRMYCESCASVGLMMFGQRMAALTGKATFYDEVERALCNTVLAGVSATGDRYFYVNPLEVWPDNCLPATSMAHVRPERQKWFNVACCPTNIARTLASLGQYIYAESEEVLYINMLISSRIKTKLNESEITVEVVADFIQGDCVRIIVSSQSPQKVRVRIPSYVKTSHFTSFDSVFNPDIANGYAELQVSGGKEQVFCFHLGIRPRFLAANEQVRADAGRLALVMGPYVYCLEETDNGANLANIFVRPDTEIEIGAPSADLPGALPVLHFKGERVTRAVAEEGALYGTPCYERESVQLTAVPYGLWCNRTPGEMVVWMKALL